MFIIVACEMRTSIGLDVSCGGSAMEVHRMNTKRSSHRFFPSMRFAIGFLVLIGGIFNTMGSNILNVTIVCMVKPIDTGQSAHEPLANQSACHSSINSSASSGYSGTLDWNRVTQGFVLSANAFGALIPLLPSGWLFAHCGTKGVFLTATVLMACASLAIPAAAYVSSVFVFILRILSGISSGLAWPFVMSVVNHWAPKDELGTLIALGSSGFQIGGMLTACLAGVICATIGWQWVFYGHGILSILWAILFGLLYTDEPTKQRFMKDREAKFILMTRQLSRSATHHPLPLGAIIRSRAVWAIVAHTAGSYYLSGCVNVFLPTYYKEILFFDVTSNGVFAALPYLAQLCGRVVSGVASDKLMSYGRTMSVKLMAVFAGYIPAAMVVTFSYMSCQQATVAVAVVSVAYFFIGFITGSYIKSTSQIATRFSSSIMGGATVLGYGMSIASTYIVAALTYQGSVDEWRQVMWIAAVIVSAGTTIFILCASGEEQSWAKGSEANNPESGSNSKY